MYMAFAKAFLELREKHAMKRCARDGFARGMKSMPARRACCKGFSLVEVVIALGIVSFAIITTMSLFPIAQSTFQDSRTATIGSQIVQEIVNDYDLADLGAIYANTGSPNSAPLQNTTVSKPMQNEIRYYDDQGVRIADPQNSKSPVVYTATINLGIPTMPASSNIPGATATLVLQIELQSKASPGQGTKEYSIFLANQSELPVNASAFTN